MIFWLLDVKSTVVINNKDVAFDYTNTYYEESDAIKEAKLLSLDDNILEVSVHKWILKDDGTQEHSKGDGSRIISLIGNIGSSNSKKLIALINEIVYNESSLRDGK